MIFKQARLEGFLEVWSEGKKKYEVDTENITCSCQGYYFWGQKKDNFLCKHLKELKRIEDELNNKG